VSAGSTPSGNWVNVQGSGNNIATGDDAHAGNMTFSRSSDSTTEVRAALDAIRRVAASSSDRGAAGQAEAAVSAIEADLAKPPTHRFSISGALSALGTLAGTIAGLAPLVDALTKIVTQ
jgi:hypothetical protein